MGRIGRAVAERAKGFSMDVLYYSRSRDEEAEGETGAQYVPLERLLSRSDFISIHLPLTPETRHFISAREMALMKPTAVLINTSRGAVIDEAALIDALRAGSIWAAGLDVFEKEPLPPDSPLRAMDNVVLLPHIGSATIKTRTEMAVLAAKNLATYLTKGSAITPVNAAK
jgi:glyoxylate reductase